jgi:ligand-binding sensor domain-containing protein
MVISMTRLDTATILAGTNLGRIYAMDNNGVLGDVLNASMTPVAYIHSLAVNDSGHIFAATESGLYRSNDHGATWTTLLPGKEVRAILFGAGGYIYAGTWSFGVYRSDDFGYTWVQKNDNLTNTVIHALMDRSNYAPQYTVFAGTFGRGVSATYNYANTWMELPTPYDFVTCMNKTNEGIIFIGTLTDGVYRSYDNGNTWNHLSGLPDGPIYAIRVDGLNNIFVSSWMFGIYASADLGDSWSYLGLGGYGISATFPGPNNKFFAAGSNGKIYVNNSPMTGLRRDDQPMPMNYSLDQNYPNPFNPTTTIQFALPENANVKINIYNSLGEKIVELANGNYNAGYHSLQWNAAGIPSGIYFYELRTEKFSSVKKLILLK